VLKIVTRRSAKNKGASMEYDTLESLQKKYPEMYLTSKQGFQQQYDLRDDKNCIVVECKRHAGFSWNELIKLFNKLETNAPEGYTCYLIVKANRQPCLVMQRSLGDVGPIYVDEFEDSFSVPFIKHTPIKKK